jgi:hypothetical protein
MAMDVGGRRTGHRSEVGKDRLLVPPDGDVDSVGGVGVQLVVGERYAQRGDFRRHGPQMVGKAQKSPFLLAHGSDQLLQTSGVGRGLRGLVPDGQALAARRRGGKRATATASSPIASAGRCHAIARATVPHPRWTRRTAHRRNALTCQRVARWAVWLPCSSHSQNVRIFRRPRCRAV